MSKGRKTGAASIRKIERRAGDRVQRGSLADLMEAAANAQLCEFIKRLKRLGGNELITIKTYGPNAERGQ